MARKFTIADPDEGLSTENKWRKSRGDALRASEIDDYGEYPQSMIESVMRRSTNAEAMAGSGVAIL